MGAVLSIWNKWKRGPLFYWRICNHKPTIGRAYFWMTPWFTLWFLWDAPWDWGKNGRFLFRGMVLEYNEHDKEGFITFEVERKWLIKGKEF